MTAAALTVHIAPVLPDAALYTMAGAVAVLFVLSALLFRRGVLWRAVAVAAFALAFLNPSLTEEERRPVPDVAALVVDRSPSQQDPARAARTAAAVAALEKKLGAIEGLEVRTVEAPAGGADALAEDTRLFTPLDAALADVPQARRAGVILITDGQVHDVPADPARFTDYGPVSALLTGTPNERDRRITVLEAPAYGIVGQDVTVRYRVEDTANIHAKTARVTVQVNGDAPRVLSVPVGAEQRLSVTVGHAGQNIVDLRADPLEGEITARNNRAPLIVNGVRDRLRVLLVSGQPHAGGRIWRNILTADPGVDLVHFTILREPDKLDATPQNELSLIAFPFRELFEVKLYDFDLIIFDRYRLNRILPLYYFSNIADYVKKGGALLEASGPAFAADDSVYGTALQDILPAMPTGQVMEESFVPALTETGLRHPVTQGLDWPGGTDGKPGWGGWLRQVGVRVLRGETLMTGARATPLLVLDRIGEGRVAQLASDEIWLWSRGYRGGGPQADLLRRLAHWLMKEPELEEDALALRLAADGRSLLVTRRALRDIPLTATLTLPDGTARPLDLRPDGKGALTAAVPVERSGIYTVDDGAQTRFVVAGSLNPLESRGVVATPDLLAPLIRASKGGILWLADTPAPAVRMGAPGRDFRGAGWIGLRRNGSYAVTGVRDRPFFPAWLSAFMLVSVLLVCWWREGRGRR